MYECTWIGAVKRRATIDRRLVFQTHGRNEFDACDGANGKKKNTFINRNNKQF